MQEASPAGLVWSDVLSSCRHGPISRHKEITLHLQRLFLIAVLAAASLCFHSHPLRTLWLLCGGDCVREVQDTLWQGPQQHLMQIAPVQAAFHRNMSEPVFLLHT